MEDANNKQKKNKLLIPIIIILGLSILGNIFQLSSSHIAEKECIETTDSLNTEVNQIDQLYDQSMAMVGQLRKDSIQLSDNLKSTISEIEKIKAENKNLLATVKDKDELNRRLKANLAMIKKLNKDLTDEVAALKKENQVLTAKNETLTSSVDSLTESNVSLTKKVEEAQKLKVEYLQPKALRERFFNDEFKETESAKRTKKIQLGFSVLKNPLAQLGERTAYVRILSPENLILGNGEMASSNFITEKGDTIKFSMKKNFNYLGEKEEVLMEYKESNLELAEGTYKIEVYIGGYKSATTNIELK